MEQLPETLTAYVNAQRAGGVSDETIYQTLISSGWQPVMVTRALAPQATSTEPSSSQNPQSTVQHQAQPSNSKNTKKIQIIAGITLFFGILRIVESLLFEINVTQIIFSSIEIVIGIGLLTFNKIAYIAYIVMAAIGVLGSLLSLPSLGLVTLLMVAMPSTEMVFSGALAIFLCLGPLAFYAYCLFLLHKKEVRFLFFRH